MAYAAGVLTLFLPDRSLVNFTGSIVSPPPVLPLGVVPNSLPIVNVAPATPYPDLATALLAVKDGGTVNIAAGVYRQSVHIDVSTFPSGLTIVGAGAYRTILDGQGGIGAGYRLAWGKGVIHINAPNCVIRNIGFVNGGGADLVGDGEAGVYSEQTSGMLTVSGCAFDGCENGIVGQRLVFTTNIVNCDFGKNRPNGQSLDGLSHDIYVMSDVLTETNCRHYNCLNGHGLKSRSKHVTTQGNYFAHGGGRCVDLPEGTATSWLSTNDVFTDLPGASTNLIGYANENSGNGNAGAIINNARIAISRFNTTIWVNDGVLTFSRPYLTAFQDGVAASPSLTIEGPGTVVGLPPLPAPVGGPLSPPISPL